MREVYPSRSDHRAQGEFLLRDCEFNSKMAFVLWSGLHSMGKSVVALPLPVEKVCPRVAAPGSTTAHQVKLSNSFKL